MTRPALFFQLRQAEFVGDLLKDRQPTAGNLTTKLENRYLIDL